MELLLFQYRRQLVSDLLLQVPKSGSLITGHIPGLKEEYSDLLDHLNNEIFKTVKLVTDDLASNPDEKDQVVTSEASLEEDLSDDESLSDDLASNPEETEQDEASETSLDEDLSDDESLSDDEGREWSELLEYEGEAGEFNIDDKE